MHSRTRHIISYATFACILAAWPCRGFAERLAPVIPASIVDKLSTGMAQDLIILYDGLEVETEAADLRHRARKEYDDDNILALRRERYRSIKRSAAGTLTSGDYEELREYDQLPISFLRVKNRAALYRLLADPRVKGVYEDGVMYTQLTSSLPFIGQPAIAAAGFTGNGTTVAVIDTGINYQHAAFGSCSTPGTPAGCRVVASIDCSNAVYPTNYSCNGTNTLNTDPNGHGTNVAGIVAGVAPGARIAAINVFTGTTASDSAILAGINWAIKNRSASNIVAINMSLGDNLNYTAPCSDSTHPANTRVSYTDAVLAARNAGIITVAASGNNGYTNGISSPACTPGVVSVGAVYDSNLGTVTYGSTCSDSPTGPDRITCFSNSASFLTMLAPGAQVTAAGIVMYGTSQASPHVAGAVALVRAAYPAETLDQTVARLVSSGVPVTDPRNGFTIPRLNLSGSIDLIPPTVALTTPASGSTVSGTITVAASASDNVGVSKVEFYLNSTLISTGLTPPYSFSWDTSTVLDGSQTLWAVAYDAAANFSQSTTVSVSTSQPLPVPAFSTWGLLVTTLCLAGIIGGAVSPCRKTVSTISL